MITKLQSLPNYYRSEASPKVQDSAFPPFKIEHRYRGVYERAGFDVNLSGMKGDANHDSTSIGTGTGGYITPPKSVSPPASTASSTSGKRVLNGSKRLEALRKTEANSAELKKEKFTPYDTFHKMPSSASSLPVFPEHKDKSIPYPSAPYTSGGRTPYKSEGDILLKQNAFDTAKNDDNIRSVKHPDHQKNHKNLRLNLGIHPSTSNAAGLVLPISSNPIIPQENLQTSLSGGQSPLKPTPSAENSRPYPAFDTVSPPLETSGEASRVDDELDEDQQFNFNTPFQKQGEFGSNDVGEGQNITSNIEFRQREELENSPQIPPRNDQRMMHDSPANLTILVSRFDSFIKNSERDSRGSIVENETLNPYENNGHDQFLKNPQRVSNLSMVSSIISKTSDYDEDDEIEKELERQLESLKVGGSTADMGVQDDSKDNEHNLQMSTTPPFPAIPTINVEDIDNSIPLEYTTPNSSFHSVNTSYNPTENQHSLNDNDETRSTFSFETIEPLSIRQNDSYSTDNTTGYGTSDDAYNSSYRYDRNLTFSENNHLTDSTTNTRTLIPEDDDLVKPLSPKTHQVEKELRDIGMRNLNDSPNSLNNNHDIRGYPLQDITDQDVLPSNDIFGDEINEHDLSLQANASLKYPLNSNDLESYKYPPGEGPCRSCKLEIDSNGKGLQRAIHSKTGELSGQWHRGCFHCSFDGCKISFNKNVHCYVLNDQPLCRQHYHEQNNTICESCNLGIEGECVVNELEQKWHLNCLLCHSCQNSINSDYYLINGSVFCEKDAEEIINRRQTYGDNNGLTSKDKIEKRRTRLLFVE